MRKFLLLFPLIFVFSPGWASIPATPVMTLYRFNGDLEVPYYDIESFARSGPSQPSGRLTQGTSLIPCLVVRNGRPLMDRQGTPYVGFEIVVNSRTATPAATNAFKTALQQRRNMTVTNHHCDDAVRHVISIRKIYALDKAPFFDPPFPSGVNRAIPQRKHHSELDQIVQAFHNSAY